ncbi:MAG: hypothetical protein U0S76_14145, partial [Pseudoxanthomonas sp.]|nr:hypothetical protein [Pseudoxanthomonas sp.]
GDKCKYRQFREHGDILPQTGTPGSGLVPMPATAARRDGTMPVRCHSMPMPPGRRVQGPDLVNSLRAPIWPVPLTVLIGCG